MVLSEIQIQRAFRAIAGGFFVLGWLVPTMFAQFPTIRERLEIEEWQITVFILTMAVGAVPSLIGGSFVIARVGGQRLALTFLPIFLIFPLLFALVPSYPLMLLIGLCLGISTGFFDVAANSQGSLLERATDRLFMTSIHAMFATGVLVGSVLATLAFGGAHILWQFLGALIVGGEQLSFAQISADQAGGGMALWQFFLILSLVSSTLIFFVRRDYLPFSLEAKYDERATQDSDGSIPRLSLWLLVGLCILMLLSIEAEASHYDWLTQYFAKEFLINGQALTEWWFNLAMVFFSSGLLVARLMGDGIANQIGRPRLLLFGTLIGLAGLLWLIVTPIYWQGLIASFLMGFGFAFFFPIFVAAAGRLNGVRPAFGVALVSAMGWASIFLGPPLIGFVEHQTDSFRWAYATIIPVVVIVAIFGPWVVFKSRPENH